MAGSLVRNILSEMAIPFGLAKTVIQYLMLSLIVIYLRQPAPQKTLGDKYEKVFLQYLRLCL